MEQTVIWLVGEEKLLGKVGEDEGEGLALRKEGEEILFAPFGKGLRWVPIGDFSTILEEEEDAGDAAPPREPFTPRRRRE